MTPKEKATHLSILFTSSTDVVKPNIASIKMALLCVGEIIKAGILLAKKEIEEDNLTDKHLCYWQDVEAELTLLYYKIIG